MKRREKRIISNQLEASALYYVLFIGMICALVSASLLTLAHLFKMEDLGIERKGLVLVDFQSAVNILLADPPCGLGESVVMGLFDHQRENIRISRTHWGLFEVAQVSAFQGTDTITKTYFVGQCSAPNERVAFYLEDRNRPLSLCGKTLIEGTCYLPKAGVKRAYIEGQTFHGEHLIHGSAHKNSEPLPELLISDTTLDRLYASFTDEASGIEGEVLNDRERVSFNAPSVMVHLNTPTLKDVQWSGKVMLVSKDRLVIEASAQLKDVIVVAPCIRFEQGFKGSGQFFATDSIILEEAVHLRYPSVAMIRKQSLDGNARVRLEPGSRLEGMAALIEGSSRRNSQSLIEVHGDATVEGLIYTNAGMDHQGMVHGSVYTNRFLLSTPSSVYENHLLNATISSEQLHDRFAFPAFVESNGKRALMQWVN